MTTAAGIYDISSGRVEVRADSSIIFHRMELRPAPIEEQQARQPQSIEQLWKSDNNLGLTYAIFVETLESKGYKKGDNLHLTGKEVRELYRCLEASHCLSSLPSMVEVYNTFALTFKMKFKGPSSLQRLRDIPDDINVWFNTFAFCVSNSNATAEDDKQN